MSGDKEYRELPVFYDALMRSVPYSYWTEYIRSLFDRYGIRPGSILDVACGTGTMTREFADLGMEAVGLDISQGMIDCARDKYPWLEFHCADAAEFDLGRRFDCAVSLFDSLNYITDKERLRMAFRCVEKHLEPGGCFIFDMNTIYALSMGFFRQADLEGWPHYIWEPKWDPRTRICRVDMTFEVRDETGKVSVVKECHVQKGYRQKEIVCMLEDAGLSFEEAFDAYTLNRTNKRSDRIFYVARKY